MLIGKSWKIESDSLNIILYQKKERVKKDTKEPYQDWEVKGYFATVEGALHELVNQNVRDTELKDLLTIQVAINAIHRMIQKLDVSRLKP